MTLVKLWRVTFPIRVEVLKIGLVLTLPNSFQKSWRKNHHSGETSLHLLIFRDMADALVTEWDQLSRTWAETRSQNTYDYHFAKVSQLHNTLMHWYYSQKVAVSLFILINNNDIVVDRSLSAHNRTRKVVTRCYIRHHDMGFSDYTLGF